MGLPRDFVVFDTETTGMPPGARLVEIGALRVRGASILARFERLVFPEMPIPERVVAVHGIHDQTVASAPTAAEVLPEFFSWIGELPLVGHNVSFDASMLAGECVRIGLALPENPTYCTLGAARSILRRRSHSLENLARDFSLPNNRFHRAADDAETTLHLLWKLQEIAGPAFHVRQLGSGAPVSSFIPRPTQLPESRALLADAAQTMQAVDLHYRTAQGRTLQLTVTPRFFYRSRNNIVMEALCHLSGHYKTYRLERVLAAHPCPEARSMKVRRPLGTS
jgi:DNA polymerase III epsilon subunit family exonuclease